MAHDDPFDLERFVKAQQLTYVLALRELRSGRKLSHWMWWIFPQIDGLGFSSTTQKYSIKSLDEAEAYLAHPVLGQRLLECAEAVLAVENRTAHQIMGSPDDVKLHSSATLFACASPPASVFHQLLDKYFNSEPDQRTLEKLGLESVDEAAGEK
jgi:uncharacterized protein (DUF1810 family)